jgi:type III restriction enzyme
LILETKGFDPLLEVKQQAARRWVKAVNADGSYGRWDYVMARQPAEVRTCIEAAATLPSVLNSTDA